MAKRDPAREQRWRELIEAQSTSGMTARAYCRERGLNEHTFYTWRRNLRATAGDSARPVFAEVGVQDASSVAMTLELPGGIMARLPVDASVETLTNVLVAARRADAPSC
jgi:transposase-like protein